MDRFLKGIYTIFLINMLFMSSMTENLFSQMIIEYPLEILDGINTGTIQATVNPPFTTNDITNVFDGNEFTTASVQNSYDLSITLAFNDTTEFFKNIVYFETAVDWSLEIDNSEEDLNTASGSYQLLVNQRHQSGWVIGDSVEFRTQKALYIRLKAHNSQNNLIRLGEWKLIGFVSLTNLYIYPQPVKIIPGTSLQLKIKALDADENIYDYPGTEPLQWDTGDNSIATVAYSGYLQGVAIGNTYVTAHSSSNSISGSTPVSVVTDFQSVNAPSKTVKVALVLQDPVIDSVQNRRIHQVWGWSNPSILVSSIIEDFSTASEGVINFQIVETYDDENIFTMLDTTYMTIDTLAYYFDRYAGRLYGRTTPGTLQYLAEIQNRVKFNYNAMVDFYDFDTKRNNGVIDEIWVYTFPFGGMYESQLIGPGAFWYNSPPLDHPGLNKLLSVMGWNYERGIAEALHSLGHRAESTMSHVYGRWQGDPPPEDPNMWEIFAQIDIRTPELANCGNIHYPPNGESDYDYANPRFVMCYCDNWKRYPLLLNQSRSVNCEEWSYFGGDYQRGFLLWWYNHLPRFEGVYEGVLNNWWHYIVDYEEAVALANGTPWVSIEEKGNPRIPEDYRLNQNYPNPFNPTTIFSFYLPTSEKVTLKIYDILGREVDTLMDKKLTAGEHQLEYDASTLATGLYFYKLTTDHFSQTKKMLLLK